MLENNNDSVHAVVWEGGVLRLLDQRLLPHKVEYLSYADSAEVASAIRDMVVRGAPAIGVAAAYAVVLSARAWYARVPERWKDLMETDIKQLAEARPTAVNLCWALEKMRVCLAECENPEEGLLDEAKRIHAEDVVACQRMGELGAELIESRCSVLTHCNAGALATGGYGTALGVIRSANKAGKIQHVYADETRPWLQGSRLTAWEMVQEKIPVTVLVEGAAAHLMKQGKVQWVIVGSDRIAANGDVANKIGTYNLAVVARYHGVKFMVVAPTSTIDMRIGQGDQIPIELRSEDEVMMNQCKRVAAEGAVGWNPAFDVTPAELVDAIVTEKGVVFEPTAKKMAALMAQ